MALDDAKTKFAARNGAVGTAAAAEERPRHRRGRRPIGRGSASLGRSAGHAGAGVAQSESGQPGAHRHRSADRRPRHLPERRRRADGRGQHAGADAVHARRRSDEDAGPGEPRRVGRRTDPPRPARHVPGRRVSGRRLPRHGRAGAAPADRSAERRDLRDGHRRAEPRAEAEARHDGNVNVEIARRATCSACPTPRSIPTVERDVCGVRPLHAAGRRGARSRRARPRQRRAPAADDRTRSGILGEPAARRRAAVAPLRARAKRSTARPGGGEAIAPAKAARGGSAEGGARASRSGGATDDGATAEPSAGPARADAGTDARRRGVDARRGGADGSGRRRAEASNAVCRRRKPRGAAAPRCPTPRNPRATTIDALFGPLPTVETVGRVWRLRRQPTEADARATRHHRRPGDRADRGRPAGRHRARHERDDGNENQAGPAAAGGIPSVGRPRRTAAAGGGNRGGGGGR